MQATITSKALSSIVFLLGSAMLVSCDKTSQVADDPAKECAAPGTAESIKSIILNGASDDVGTLYPGFTKEFIEKSQITIDLPALVSYDTTTKKITCSGKISFNWFLPMKLNNEQELDAEQEVIMRLASARESINNGQSEYTIQPDATGKQIIYGVDHDTANQKIVAEAYIAAEYKLQNSDKAPPAQAPTPQADATAPASGTSNASASDPDSAGTPPS